MCVWKLNYEPVLWEEHSCWVSTSFSNSYGRFGTFQYKSPPPEIHTHHKKKTGWVFYSAPGHEVAPEERFWNPNTSHSIPDCSQNTNLYESAIWSRSGENLALPQMSAFQDLRKTAFFWTCSAMLLCFFFFLSFTPWSSERVSQAQRGCRVFSAQIEKCNHSTDVSKLELQGFHMTTLISSFIKHSWEALC